jgi:hypothetical protein
VREAAVRHVAREVHVGPGQIVVQEHPADLRGRVAPIDDLQRIHAESGLDEHARPIHRQAHRLGELVERQSLARLARAQDPAIA